MDGRSQEVRKAGVKGSGKNSKKYNKGPKRKPLPAPAKKSLNIELEEDAAAQFMDALERFDADSWSASKNQSPRRATPSTEITRLSTSLDLHGMTLEAAKAAVTVFIQGHRAQGKGAVSLKIITGKGLHSGPGGGVLSREVHSFVVKAFQSIIVNIEAAPADTEISRGVLWRGHFSLTIKCD